MASSVTKSLGTDQQCLDWLLETLGQGLWEWHVQTGEVRFSPTWLRHLGYDPADVLPDVSFLSQNVHPDDYRRAWEVVQAHLEGHTEQASWEYRIRAKTGEWHWSFDRARVVERAADGSPVRVLGVSTDITTTKRAESECRESSRMVTVLLETAPVAIITLGPDRLVRTWNAAAERILGWSAAEAIGRPMPVVRPEKQDAYESEWQGMAAGRSYHGIERQVRHKDGRTVDVKGWTVPVPGADEGLAGVLCLLQDHTEQKRLEAQLLQAQGLENTGQLAGAIAHDFNNLLTVINGYSEIALGALEARDPLYANIREIKRAGDRAASLTQQLLAFSRRQVMQPTLLDLNGVLADLEPVVRGLLGDTIRLALRPQTALGTVEADPVQIRQVLLNLAVNARDAMPGGGTLTVETSNVEFGEEARHTSPDLTPGSYVLLSVTDTGTGMDEATLARLFEPFFTTKERGTGSGLGLSAVYGIVKQSGGTITAESKPGQGSRFRVYLPRVAAPVATSTVAAPGGPEVSGHESILLVEDQPEVRHLAARALELYGYQVLPAPNGAEALDLLHRESGPIDLLLTDVRMPGMPGPELARAVVATRPDIRVLLMSGYSEETVASDGRRAGGFEYIQKPFTPEGLARRVRQILDARRGPGQVLVVDDEAEIRRLLRQFLEHAGYDVAEAADGRQAVARVDAGGVALVITDLVMPEKEGIETIREMRQRHRGVKIIAMSGAFGGRFLRTAEMLGAHATLSKPVRAEQLVRTVGEVLAQC